MSFENLKKSSAKDFGKLTEAIEKISTSKNSSKNDERFWKLTVDKAQNGAAVIRFLPAPEGEDFPFVRLWDHGFQGPTGKWYIENSLTTLNGKKDPVSEYNSILWATGDKDKQNIVRKRKRRLSYYSNILVVNDPANPENNGKVFLFKYGVKIWEKILSKMNPEFDDEEAVNPFDFWSGANFKLRARQISGSDGKSYRNYDQSSFDTPTPIAENDEEIKKIWEQQYSLQEIVDPSNFKSYEELQERLMEVLGVSRSELTGVSNDEASSPMPQPKSTSERSLPSAEAELGVENSGDDDDDDISFFKQLAE